ncbi:hypothetical protein AGMMS49944_06110 [Spirochaetia bacterium]|nr:hypothetical protein AGMMS49944_06110 [Spirochaetia bacterium]
MYNENNQLLVFGTGAVADILINEYLDFGKNTIMAFVNSVSNSEKEKNGYPVIPLEKIVEYKFDYILLAAGRYDRLYDECIQIGIPENKIIGIIPEGSKKLILSQNKINESVKELFNLNIETLFKKPIPTFFNSTINFANELWLDNNVGIMQQYENIDIQRVMALKAVSREIILNNVPGNMAELGVYRGDFAKILNQLFPEKKLYLFDTFGGFQNADLKEDKNKYLSKQSTEAMFKDTTIDLVLSKMPHKEKCRIIKGFFPESVEGIEDTFAFVSLDADLYQPIYDGLVYFYQRLSHGGYIFIHDFNNAYFSGTRKAVMEYCNQENIGYVPILDYSGSVIITK